MVPAGNKAKRLSSINHTKKKIIIIIIIIIRTYKNTQKIDTDQGHDYTTGCLLDYTYSKENHMSIAINLSKSEELDGDPKAKQ